MPTIITEDKTESRWMMPEEAQLIKGTRMVKRSIGDDIHILRPEYTCTDIDQFLLTGTFTRKHQDLPDPELVELLKATPYVHAPLQLPELDDIPSPKQKAKTKATARIRAKLGLKKKKRKKRSDAGKKRGAYGPRKKNLTFEVDSCIIEVK